MNKKEMKKIGILNYQYSNHNYGAVLQAASLNWYLMEKLGLVAEHINYIPQLNPLSLKQKIKSYLGHKLREVGLKKQAINHNSFENPFVFEQFRNLWLPRTDVKFSTLEKLQEYNFDYSHIIVGSDQVWRPSYTENSALVYFLAFVKENIKRISYAASFGNDRWELNLDDDLTNKVREEINKFDSISVREDSGVEVCKTIFGINKAEHVLDPTLLCGRDFFDLIEDKIKLSTNNIVYYKLDIDEKFNQFLKFISEKSKCNLDNIYYKQDNGKYFYETVENWVSKIKNSNLVITDSFHCICLSIIFEKEFIYYPNNDNRGLSRLMSLLSSLGLVERIYDLDSDFSSYYQSLKKINYQTVNEKLEKMRNTSKYFLKHALERK